MSGADLPVPENDDQLAGQSLDLDLLASSLHADSGDLRVLLKALVSRLADALGARLQVERTGGGGLLRKKPGEISRVRVILGDDQLEAAVTDGRVECSIAHSSGGIRIRSVKVGIDQWLQALLVSLRDEAETSQTTRLALEGLLIGDGQ
jgi:hypothetical protein